MNREILVENGCCLVPCRDPGHNYVAVKWYGHSLAIFEETAFKNYLQKLDTDFRENNHGPSVMRFFLASAATMLINEGNMRVFPAVLIDAIAEEGETLVFTDCPCPEAYVNCFPKYLLASSACIDSAIQMTKDRHMD